MVRIHRVVLCLAAVAALAACAGAPRERAATTTAADEACGYEESTGSRLQRRAGCDAPAKSGSKTAPAKS